MMPPGTQTIHTDNKNSTQAHNRRGHQWQYTASKVTEWKECSLIKWMLCKQFRAHPVSSNGLPLHHQYYDPGLGGPPIPTLHWITCLACTEHVHTHKTWDTPTLLEHPPHGTDTHVQVQDDPPWATSCSGGTWRDLLSTGRTALAEEAIFSAPVKNNMAGNGCSL